MIKRVFKTIFILSLCLGITLPANAGSVDVSDGSAFITKSELSYQLNALSSRMTQLENSLDSKIDKLVSSYLTRNGVWNGVKQTQKFNYICDMFGNKVSQWTEYYSPNMPTISAAGIEGVLYDKTYILVETINKSGLLVAVVDVFDQGSYYSRSLSDKRAYYYLGTWRQLDTGASNILYTDSSEVGFYIAGDNKAKVRAFGWILSPINNSCGVSLNIYPGTYVVNFFVDKNDRLDFRYKQAMIPMSQSAKECLSGAGANQPSGGKPGIKITIKSLIVY